MTALALYNRPTAVYRLFANDGALLYVGCTCDPHERFFGHQGKHWWPSATHVATEWFNDRFTALLQEAQAIIDEAPIHNIRRTPPNRIRARKPTPEPAPRNSGLTFAQVAEEVDIPVHWLWRGVVIGKLPHSCLDPEGDDVWFAPEDIRDLHIIYDLPPVGLRGQRASARSGIRRALRFKHCLHAAI